METFTCVQRRWGLNLFLLCSAFLFLRGAAVDVSAETGENVTLVCGLGGNYPEWLDPDGNVLTADNAVTSPGMEYVDMKDLRITNVKTSHAGDYTCRLANNAENTVTLIVNSFDYVVSFSDVYNPPLDSSFIPVRLFQDNLIVTCTVANAFPVPQVALGFLTPGLVVDDVTVVSAEQQADNTFTVIVSGKITVSPEVDLEGVYCKATSGDRSVESIEQLKVVYPPPSRSFEGNDNLLAEYGSGNFFCQTAATYPPMEFQWVLNGSSDLLPGFIQPDPTKCTSIQGAARESLLLTDGTFHPVEFQWVVNGSLELPSKLTQPSPGQCTSIQGSTNQLRSTLYNCESRLNFTALPREYNGVEVYCDLIFVGRPYQHDSRIWTLSLAFPPTTATILESADTIPAEEGGNITVACKTDASYSGLTDDDAGTLTVFDWLIDDRRMTSSDDAIYRVSHVEEPVVGGLGFTTTMTVSFPATREMNGAMLFCRVKSGEWSSAEMLYVKDSIKLKVEYGPALSQPSRSEYRAYYGVPVEIPCVADSLPVSEITWYRLLDDGNSSDVAEFNAAVQVGNLLVFNVSPDKHNLPAGVYRCVANNGIGQMSSRDIQLNVDEKPPPPGFGVSREDATSFTVDINMAQPDGILAYVYVQYRRLGEDGTMYRPDATWSEDDKRFPDADYGSSTDTAYSLTVTGLQPGVHYETRLKIVDSEGRTYYTLNTLYLKTKETSGKGLKTWSQYRDVILICVLVTFGVMLIILIVTIVCLKRGACAKQDGVDMVAMHNR